MSMIHGQFQSGALGFREAAQQMEALVGSSGGRTVKKLSKAEAQSIDDLASRLIQNFQQMNVDDRISSFPQLQKLIDRAAITKGLSSTQKKSFKQLQAVVLLEQKILQQSMEAGPPAPTYLPPNLQAVVPSRKRTLSAGEKKYGSLLTNIGVGDYKTLKAELAAKNVNKANNLASSLISLNTRLFGEYSFEKKNLGNVEEQDLSPKLSDLSAQHHNVELAIFSAITSGIKMKGSEALFKEMLSCSEQLGQIYQKIGPKESFSKLTPDEKKQLKENLQSIGKKLLQVENKLRSELNAIDAKKNPDLKDAMNTLLAAVGYTGASSDLLSRCFA